MITRLATLVAFLLVASAAHAQSIIWSAVGTTCVPDGATVGHYTTGTSVASVRHLGNQTGTLTFTCRVSRVDTATTDWVLKLSYRDSTGTGGGASVVAKLYRLRIGNYTPALIDTVTSNSSSVTGNNTINSTASFSHTFNFDMNTYFVQVVLTRASSSQNVQFHSTAIEEK